VRDPGHASPSCYPHLHPSRVIGGHDEIGPAVAGPLHPDPSRSEESK
jgi:hypothetical protein